MIRELYFDVEGCCFFCVFVMRGMCVFLYVEDIVCSYRFLSSLRL